MPRAAARFAAGLALGCKLPSRLPLAVLTTLFHLRIGIAFRLRMSFSCLKVAGGGGIDIGPSLVLPVDSATVAFAANGVLNTKPGGKSCLSGLRSRTLFGLRHWLCKLLFYSDSSNCFPWLYLCCVNSLSRSIHPNNNSNRL